jgi:hypothetical protein
MKWLLLCAMVATAGCSQPVETYPEPDGDAPMLLLVDWGRGHIPNGVYAVRDYEHGQLCTVAKTWEGVAISCQSWELPVP